MRAPVARASSAFSGSATIVATPCRASASTSTTTALGASASAPGVRESSTSTGRSRVVRCAAIASATRSTRSRSAPLTQTANGTPSSRRPGRDAREPPGAEDHLPILHDELVVQEELHRLREHLRLERPATRLHVLERVLADADVEDVLQNDGSRVELLGDEVRGTSGDAHALLPRLLVGV